MPYLNQEPPPPVFVLRPLAAKGGSCCGAHQAAPQPATARRTRLAELDNNMHCSIIGTCLGTGELRKLVPRLDPGIDRKSASDLEIHHAAVNLSTSSDAAARELGKALDARHALAIRRFKAAASEAALGVLWREAMAAGDVPGAYWALLTHPLSSFALRCEAFGDVHMLSHLVGASNRADLRRLAVLEEECVQLRARNADQQRRLGELGAASQQAAALAQEQALQLAALREQLAAAQSHDAARVREALALQQSQLALATQRCADAEARLRAGEALLATLRGERDEERAELAQARTDTEMLESALAQAFAADGAAPALPALGGMAIAYVGGRQQSTAVLARLVADAGGELLLHDGGVEDRKGLLASTLSRAQLVVFPVDCISHNAMHLTRQLAAHAGIPCYPLRKASIASFARLMHEVAGLAEALG